MSPSPKQLSRFCLLPLVLFLAWGAPRAEAADGPTRPRRSDSFFGVHFDFHAELTDPVIGGTTTPEMVNALIDITRPDYFEIDTKGHPGISSYPTKAGNHAGRFAGDPLRVWRDVTAARSVALYGHHSGIWDKRAFELHPEWAALDAGGNPIAGKMSVAGPYAEQLLIPQLLELAGDYRLDGAWVDGDCWSVERDWSDALVKAFEQRTGSPAPRNPGDPLWHEWSNFNRQAFRDYVGRYISAVKKEYPDFQFCSNWAFSLFMPERPLPGIDFVSGDICGTNCVNVCRYISRLFATQEIPWDLMSWSYSQWSLGTLEPPETRKTAVQLQREAACVIAQGGGYQAVFSQAPAGYPPVRDGSVDIEKVRLFSDVERFCAEREEICFKAKPIPQIALLLSTEGTYRRWDAAGGPLFWWDRWQQDGIGKTLVEDRQAVSVLVTETMMERMNEFPLIVVFGWDYIEPDLAAKLGEYVENGGRLYLVGPAMPEIFRQTLDKASSLREGSAPQGWTLRFHTVGKGMIALTPQINPPSDFVKATVHEIFPDPMVKIEGEPQVDLSLMRTPAGQIAVHLVNVSGPHETADVIETIDPVGPVTLRVRLPERPKSVTLQPGRRAAAWDYADGEVQLTVDSVPIHEIVLIEE